MTALPSLRRGRIVALLVFLISPLCIAASFGGFVELGQLPWLRTCLVATLLSSLMPFALTWERDVQTASAGNGAFITIYSGVFYPCILMTIIDVPAWSRVGFNDDSVWYAIFSLSVVHGVGTWMMSVILLERNQAKIGSIGA